MVNTFDGTVFAEKALATVPRVLGLCDREPDSPTFGCCDRTYWHYRLTDVANARFQEAGLLLALAYSTPLPRNRFAGKEKMKQWIRGVWRFWLEHRNADGSTNELYPHEHSFCSTAFSAAAFLESVPLLDGTRAWQDELSCSRGTLCWLGCHANRSVANQMAASLHALTLYGIFTNDAAIKKMSSQRRETILEQVGSGCEFSEYGGFDLGYQSITLSILARTALLTGDGVLMELVKRGTQSLAEAIGDYGWQNPEQNSRNTQFIYPYTLAVNKHPAMLRLVEGVRANRILNPTWMDDRYCIAMAIDYLLAAGVV